MTDTRAFRDPVRCRRCRRGVYDLSTVEVTARYADCSVWNAPCCGAQVDDRGDTGWTGRKDYDRIQPGSDPTVMWLDPTGRAIYYPRYGGE